MDAGQKREALTARVRDLMQNQCSCWTEVYDIIKDEVHQLAKEAKIDPVLVAFSIMDDVEAELC
jgi:hypothetical protein